MPAIRKCARLRRLRPELPDYEFQTGRGLIGESLRCGYAAYPAEAAPAERPPAGSVASNVGQIAIRRVGWRVATRYAAQIGRSDDTFPTIPALLIGGT